MSEQVPLDGTLLTASELPSTSITGSNPSIQQTQDKDGTVMTVDTENNTNSSTTSTNNNSDDHQYIQQERMIEDIANQIKQEQALTSEKLLLSSIQQQYRNNNNNNNNNSGSSTVAAAPTDTNTTNTFITGLIELENTYSHIRTVRGDGNCYYRAFLYSLLEQLILLNTDHNNSNDTDNVLIKEKLRIYEYIKTKSWNDILQQNYDEMAIEIFHDEILDIFHKVIVDQVYNNKSNNSDNNNNNNNNNASSNTISLSFHKTMNEENAISDYCTWYLRLITATYIKQDPERFLPFIISLSYENNNDITMVCDVNQFCNKYIEPMGQECEHVQVLALAEAFQIHVRIEYLDGRSITMSPSTTTSSGNNDSKGSSVYCHQFGPETSPIQITLLYRPGHYDILYKK